MTEDTRPFQVVVSPESVGEESPGWEGGGDELSLEEIEAAYLKALETADAVELPLLGPVPGEETLSFPQTAHVEVGPPKVTPSRELNPATDREEILDLLRVVEAFLFVGNGPVTARRLQELLGGRQSPEQVEDSIHKLNEQYSSQLRPYEISLVEGGYRMLLRSEFETVRLKVYGQGPKDVKLNQESLEVLAVIAYQQPVTRDELAQTGKPNLWGIVRQLLRRQLIVLERGANQEEQFRTTSRFLELFSLRALDDLPRATDFQFK